MLEQLPTVSIMEKQPVVFGNEDGGSASGTAPAFYVLVKQPQTSGKSDQEKQVSNQDDTGLASGSTTPVKSKGKTCLPADCISGDITVTLDNNSMWNEFYHRSTEMILTKQGRRMFPYCRYWITGLESSLKYILIMDISPVDNFRYKWNGHSWEPSGKAEPHVLGRVFMHPESPSSGNYWMHQPVSFYKLKLTNNTLDQEGHIILHSMHRYLPRLHLVPADKAIEVIQLNGPDVHTFTFPQTEFFAVTAYQNIQITQLKIDYNPFAKGFRDDGLSSKPHRDVKQNGSSEQEGGSVTSSPSNHRHPTEGDILEQRCLEPSLCRMGNTDLEKELLSSDHDFLGIMDTDMHVCDSPVLKQEESESPIASPCQSNSHVASPLNSNGSINVVVKEEPADDYDYGPSVCMKEICVKQEESDKETEEYSNSDDSIPEKELKKRSEMGRKEMEIDSHKRPRSSQLGVAKAKMLKLDSGKMPVVYLEPCAVTRNTVKVSALSQTMLSLSKSDKSHLGHSGDSLPQCFESDSISSPFTVIEMEQIPVEKQFSGSNVPHTCPSFRDGLWENTEMCSSLTVAKKASSYSLKPTTYSDLLSGKDICEGGKTRAPKTHTFRKSIVGNQKVVLPGPRKRGRPRKIKQSEVGQPSKYTGKSIATSSYASLGPGITHLDVKPDLEDVDGVLFVSFASKEALDIHTIDRSEEKEELPNMQTPLLAACDSSIDSDDQRIQQLEKDLLEDLKSFKYKQVIHPSLQEVGLKLNLVDPTMSIDLKYLGVQLPLSYSNDYILWKTLGTNSSSVDTGLPFVSRTGKTNDFTKIKGWRGKLHSSSKNESSILEGSLKNRSAFCSDKLDEYLENEGKLMETSMEFSPSTSSCPVVYQLPTKSTSYVRTLDSVLKKQSTVTPSDSYIFKPLSVPSVSKKKRKNIKKIKNKKQAAPRGKEKLPHKSAASSLPVVTKQKRHLPVLEEKVAKSQPSSQTASEADAPVVPGVEENVLGKPIPVRQAQQQQQSSRLPSLSKTQLKLMDLEDCVLWDGKPRTYITEERADLSLTTLLTAQASLKNKPIHKIVKRRAPPCNNDFCRLGCVCSSLALEKRQPTHCRKPDCMFGCTCLKRRVVLVKGGFKHKKILEKPVHERHKLYSRKQPEQEEAIEKEQEKLKLKDRKRRKKVEYTICDTEPETPVKNFPLWIKVDGEMDPEPVYIPTPSAAEPTKPMMQPISEVLPSDNKPSSGGVKPSSNGAKPGRVYTPRPNPVIREEDKDPVYLYFESMMTCARVRMYERKKQEKKQQQKCPLNSERNIEKEHNPEPQPPKMEEDKESGSGQKSWWFSCSAEDPSTSYVHHTTPGGTTKLIEIVSDCNWEEDRNEILNILSQHVKTKMPKSLKVGNFVIDLESESKTWDERNTPIYSSRVKISMPSCQSKGEKARISVSESPDDRPSPCKRTEKITFLTPGMLREQRKKGLPFYAGLSPAGKLTAYTCQSDLNPSRLIQVNGKNYPQAKLLLGQMGALHPANRLAAYITGRLRPSVLDLSTLSTVISKVASGAKLAPFESQSAEVPTSDTSKTFSNMSTSTATAIGVHAPAQRQIAARPLVDALPSQLVMSVVGALQQKMPVVKTSQPLSGPQNFNIKYSPVAPATTSVATTTYATIAVVSPAVTAASPSGCNKATYSSSDTAVANAIRKLENSTSSATTTAATVTITKPTGIATSVATIAFAKSIVAASPVTVPVSTASLSPVLTTVASTATVTTPTSPTSCVLTGPSGIQTSPLSNKKPGATSPPGLSPGAEKRMGPRLLLIPVRQGSPTLQPAQNIQPPQGQGKRMILQPIRNPGGVNLYRHPNGQIIQLVPLHQFQPTKFQPSLPPVAFRSPGSVVGIQLPGPSKLSDTTVCQSTSVSSATPATMATSVLSGPPSTLLTPTTELPRVMPALRPLLPEAPSALLEARTTEAPSALLEAPTTTELPRVMPALRPLLPEAPSVLLEARTVKTPSALLEAPTTTELRVMPALRPLLPEATSALLEAPTVKPPSVLLEAPTAEAPSALPEAPIAETPSALPESSTAEAPSILPEAPTINQTLQAIRSVPAPSISATQAASIIPPVPVLVSQAGILTLRISPSGVKSIANHTDSDSKTICSMNGQPDNTLNLISLQSGSFALLQFPEQKDVSSSTVKQNVSLEVKNTNQKDEFSAVQLEEKASSSQEVEAVESEVTMSDTKTNENILLANQPDSHSEEIMDDRNTITSDLPEKGVEQLSTGPPILQPDTASSDHTYMSEKLKCEEIKMMVKMKQPAKHPKGIPGEVPYTSESVHEECSQIAALTQNTLQEQKRIRQLKSPNEEETHTVQSPAAESEEAEQMHLETEEGVMVEPSQKQLDKQKVHTNCTEKLQKKTKSSLRENQDLELLEMGTKEEDYSVATEWDQEEAGEIPKVSSAKEQNSAEEANNVGCTQEVLHKRDTSFQENCDASNHKKSTADNLEENQIAKDSLVQVGRTWNKISRQSVALESKNGMDADEYLEKHTKCIEQNTLKTSHERNDSTLIIDITMDDTEKDEKTDDSADEMVDEVSGYQSEDIVNVETLNDSEYSEVEENVDIETVEELSEKINIARMKATAAHALLSKQLHLVRDHSNKTPKQSDISDKKPKKEEEAFANYRQTHTANERRRRKEMRGLFEKLKATLGLQALPKVSKCFILKQAFEEIQGLTDQADKLTGQKNLLMRKQDTLIRKVSALSGKTQEVVLKKLEYIYAKQKAVEAQKKQQQQQAEPVKVVETAETAKPSVENSSSSLFREIKPVTGSNKRTKPLILSRKGSRVTGETSSVTLSNASLVMTAHGQVLAIKSPLLPGQVATLPSTLLQAELKSDVDSRGGATQPGIASVMIQLPGSTVPVQVKGILPNSTIPITLSAVASSPTSPVIEMAPELTSETEDSFMMPRIVNVTSLATEENTNLNLEINKNPYVTSGASSQISESSLQVVAQETTNLQSEEKADASCGKERDATGTVQDFPREEEIFPQIVNVSSLKDSGDSFATKLCIEELPGSQAEEKQTDRGDDGQKAKNSSFQKLQPKEPKDSGIEMELQKVASAIQEAALDASDLIDIEENDDTDETLTSLLNEIAFLNQQLNDDSSDIAELPNSLSSGFSLGDVENRRESSTADGSPFQFGALGGSFKDLSVVQESSDSITPLLLHLDDDDLPEGNRNSRELSSESDALKIMLGSEVKDSNPDHSAVNSGGSGKNMDPLAKTRSLSPPILQMKANLEGGNTDTTWRPMPKLAPLGLKGANFSLDSEGQNTKVMPLLAPIAAKEITAQPLTSASQDCKAMPALAPIVTRSK